MGSWGESTIPARAAGLLLVCIVFLFTRFPLGGMPEKKFPHDRRTLFASCSVHDSREFQVKRLRSKKSGSWTKSHLISIFPQFV